MSFMAGVQRTMKTKRKYWARRYPKTCIGYWQWRKENERAGDGRLRVGLALADAAQDDLVGEFDFANEIRSIRDETSDDGVIMIV